MVLIEGSKGTKPQGILTTLPVILREKTRGLTVRVQWSLLLRYDAHAPYRYPGVILFFCASEYTYVAR